LASLEVLAGSKRLLEREYQLGALLRMASESTARGHLFLNSTTLFLVGGAGSTFDAVDAGKQPVDQGDAGATDLQDNSESRGQTSYPRVSFVFLENWKKLVFVIAITFVQHDYIVVAKVLEIEWQLWHFMNLEQSFRSLHEQQWTLGVRCSFLLQFLARFTTATFDGNCSDAAKLLLLPLILAWMLNFYWFPIEGLFSKEFQRRTSAIEHQKQVSPLASIFATTEQTHYGTNWSIFQVLRGICSAPKQAPKTGLGA